MAAKRKYSIGETILYPIYYPVGWCLGTVLEYDNTYLRPYKVETIKGGYRRFNSCELRKTADYMVEL
jgi:hypothetical protein